MSELPEQVHEEIKRLCSLGDAACDDEDYESAVKHYKAAFALLPAPKTDWQASTWILTSMADAYIYDERFANALNILENVMHCPDAIGNPYIHLRLGEMRFESGDMDRAADELTRAYMGAGAEIFADEDPKYLGYLKTKIAL